MRQSGARHASASGAPGAARTTERRRRTLPHPRRPTASRGWRVRRSRTREPAPRRREPALRAMPRQIHRAVAGTGHRFPRASARRVASKPPGNGALSLPLRQPSLTSSELRVFSRSALPRACSRRVCRSRLRPAAPSRQAPSLSFSALSCTCFFRRRSLLFFSSRFAPVRGRWRFSSSCRLPPLHAGSGSISGGMSK